MIPSLRRNPSKATLALWAGAAAAVVGIAVLTTLRFSPGDVDFNRDVRPILNEKCLACHGGVKKQGGFSLLFREDALSPTESGAAAIVPGHPEESEMIRRLRHADPEERMPQEAEPLSEDEIRLVERWIRQGASWEPHWAYRPIDSATPPRVRSSWVRNGIDRFVLAGLNFAGLEPSEQADCRTLARRVHLDLIGLPPTIESVEAFCADPSDEAYVALVDELLESPRYGERWAALWLDLARYADSKGYEKDDQRTIWRYRDWVIEAFNADMPFDDFTVAQLAGDLLPNPSEADLLATAFHRNTMNNDEGGTDDEEFRVAAVFDRVNTTFEVWQGTTMGCVQCHGHPYDPFRHEEYYRLYAYFNNTADRDTPDETPTLATFGQEEAERIDAAVRWARSHGIDGVEVDGRSPADRLESLLYPGGRRFPGEAEDRSGVDAEGRAVINVRSGGYVSLNQAPLDGVHTVKIGYDSGGSGGSVEFRAGRPDGRLLGRVRLARTGGWGRDSVAVGTLSGASGVQDVYLVFRGSADRGLFDVNWVHFDASAPPRDPTLADSLQRVRTRLTAMSPVHTPILRELPEGERRVTRVLERGSFLSPGDSVAPGIPASLDLAGTGAGSSRLDFARWLVSAQNPLTARVIVNRFWARLFGRGIVETLEDFGTQGARPSHPELLDWLAVRFAHDFDWSVRALLREVVLSATYRQSSQVRRDLLQRDPQNRLLGRAPRVRLSSEQIRDQALAVSGLLSPRMFGPSVMPPQPDGIWRAPYSGMKWKESEGEERYRRGLYTYWRRTAPYPSMVAFDSPSREFCVSRRIPTNTPLQALVTLNDTVYVEAAAALAGRILAAGWANEDEAVSRVYQEALFREPDGETLSALLDLYRSAAKHFAASDTQPVRQVGLRSRLAGETERRALAVVANAVLNLDAFVTRE